MAIPEQLAMVATDRGNGLRLTIRAKPGQSKQRTPRIVDIGNGKFALEICVAAQPEDGKANAAIVKQLSAQLDTPLNAITIATGHTGKLKQVDISGDTKRLNALLQAWLI